MPVRDRTKLAAALPEVQAPGVGIALALARAEKPQDALGWWYRLFASDWLLQRLNAQHDISPQELESVQAIRSPTPPESFRLEINQLNNLQPLWSRFFQGGPTLQEVLAQRWPQQEKQLGISSLPCNAVLADGAFASLRMERGATLAQLAGGNGGGERIRKSIDQAVQIKVVFFEFGEVAGLEPRHTPNHPQPI